MLKQTEDKVEIITRAPRSGIWRLGDDGRVTFRRPALNITSVGDESEAFYLRVYGAGDYCYHGADLGILMTRGRMQSSGRELLDRAKKWNSGIKAQFASVPPPPDTQIGIPADIASGKWY